MVTAFNQTESDTRELLTLLEKQYKVKGFHSKLNIKMHIASIYIGMNLFAVVILGILASLIALMHNNSHFDQDLVNAMTFILIILMFSVIWGFADVSIKNQYAEDYIQERYQLNLEGKLLITKKVILFNYFKKHHHETYKENIVQQILIFLDDEDRKLFDQIRKNNFGLFGTFITGGTALLGFPAMILGMILLEFPQVGVALLQTKGILTLFFIGIGFFVVFICLGIFESRQTIRNLLEFLINRRYLLSSETSAKLKQEEIKEMKDFIPYFNEYFQQKYKMDNLFF